MVSEKNSWFFLSSGINIYQLNLEKKIIIDSK